MAWIEIDGVKNTAFEGVMLESASPFLLPKKKVKRTQVVGAFGSVLEGAPSYDTGNIDIKLLVSGHDRKDASKKVEKLHKWLTGSKMRLWRNEDKYVLGGIENGVTYQPVSNKTYRVQCTFTVCPPCYFKVKSKAQGFEPNTQLPIQEQITRFTETVSGTFTAPGRLNVLQDEGTHAPCLYFVIKGTYTQFTLGELTLVEAQNVPVTVYIDCVEQVVYKLEGGQRVRVLYSGEFPVNDVSGIAIGGSTFSVHVQALMIERW